MRLRRLESRHRVGLLLVDTRHFSDRVSSQPTVVYPRKESHGAKILLLSLRFPLL